MESAIGEQFDAIERDVEAKIETLKAELDLVCQQFKHKIHESKERALR